LQHNFHSPQSFRRGCSSFPSCRVNFLIVPPPCTKQMVIFFFISSSKGYLRLRPSGAKIPFFFPLFYDTDPVWEDVAIFVGWISSSFFPHSTIMVRRPARITGSLLGFWVVDLREAFFTFFPPMYFPSFSRASPPNPLHCVSHLFTSILSFFGPGTHQRPLFCPSNLP